MPTSLARAAERLRGRLAARLGLPVPEAVLSRMQGREYVLYQVEQGWVAFSRENGELRASWCSGMDRVVWYQVHGMVENEND